MAITSLTVCEYLHTAYEPDAEYVDGEIEERAAGEYDHATWQYALLRWFTAHEEEWDLRVRSELQVQVSPTRYRVPDLTVIARPLPEEQVITRAPLAVFEILSPEDRMDRVLRKLGDYEGVGILTIVLVEPKDSSASRYQDGRLFRDLPRKLDGSRGHMDWAVIQTYLD